MPAFERIPPRIKRDELKDALSNVTSNHGEDFVFYTNPVTSMLEMENRMTRRDIQENGNGKIRHMEVFIDGTEDTYETPVGGIDALRRVEGEQMGAVDNIRVVVWYGVGKNNSGNIDTFEDWWTLLTGYNPMGLFPVIRETRDLACQYQNETRTALLSTVRNPVTPPIPRPVVGTGGEFAHYAEFTVSITDM